MIACHESSIERFWSETKTMQWAPVIDFSAKENRIYAHLSTLTQSHTNEASRPPELRAQNCRIYAQRVSFLI